MLPNFFESTFSKILKLDFLIWCRKVWSIECWKLLASMLELQMKSSPLPNESLLPNMCVESLPLMISSTAVWLECYCTLLDTHTPWHYLCCQLCCKMQVICSAQSMCMNTPLSKLVTIWKLLLIWDWSWNLLRSYWRLIVFQMPILLWCIDMEQWMILSLLKAELDTWLW